MVMYCFAGVITSATPCHTLQQKIGAQVRTLDIYSVKTNN